LIFNRSKITLSFLLNLSTTAHATDFYDLITLLISFWLQKGFTFSKGETFNALVIFIVLFHQLCRPFQLLLTTSISLMTLKSSPGKNTQPTEAEKPYPFSSTFVQLLAPRIFKTLPCRQTGLLPYLISFAGIFILASKRFHPLKR
jgi:hypothetical protein